MKESQYLYKEPCPACGSKDNLARYDDGHAHCFTQGCDYREAGEGEEFTPQRRQRMSGDLIDDAEYRALGKRGITEETCRRYGYQVGTYKGRNVHVANYRDGDGVIVAQHLRYPSKDKGFPWLGDVKEATFFGQHLPIKSYKKLVVTEGEIDCLSMSQVQGNKWPVVSIKGGAGGAVKQFKAQLEWLSLFDSVILMFDMDEPGQDAALGCSKLLKPGTAKIAKLPLKDVNDMLVEGRAGELIDAMWGAQAYRPDGIISGKDIIDRLKERPLVTSRPYPEFMEDLNKKTYGIRLGELETWTSGTGMGKTTVIKQLQHHYWKTTPYNQAILHLEEPLEDAAEGLLSIHMGCRLNLPDMREMVSQEEIDKAADAVFSAVDDEGLPRFNLYDAFGSLSEDDLYSKIRYFVQSLDCKIIWLDHLSILVSDSDEYVDERRLIDSIMHNLKSLTIELGCYIGLISHLKKAPTGKSFEEGYVPSLDDLRGSAGIKQLSNSVFALSRDQQHDNDEVKNTSRVTVLKCRYTGRTGPSDFLLFDELTGRMGAGRNPEVITAFSDEGAGAFEDGGDDIPF